MDESILPISAAQKIQAIRVAGLRLRGYVIAHDIPEEKGESQKEKSKMQKPSQKPNSSKPNVEPKADESGGGFLEGVKSILRKLPVILPALLIGSLLLLDPILIAVTDDYTWVEIERWKEEEA